MQNPRNLLVWQKAYALSVRCYGVGLRIARLDRSGLGSQIQRAAQSIRANIAEGYGRQTKKDFGKFLTTAISSATELEDHLRFATDVGLLPPNEGDGLCAEVIEVRRMLFALRKKVLGDET